VTREHHGKLHVTVGAKIEILELRKKDVEPQLLVDVRRMPARAGDGPEGMAAHEVQ
jgi:hypothetical protein